MDPWLILFGPGVGVLVGTTGMGVPIALAVLTFLVRRSRDNPAEASTR